MIYVLLEGYLLRITIDLDRVQPYMPTILIHTRSKNGSFRKNLLVLIISFSTNHVIPYESLICS